MGEPGWMSRTMKAPSGWASRLPPLSPCWSWMRVSGPEARQGKERGGGHLRAGRQHDAAFLAIDGEQDRALQEAGLVYFEGHAAAGEFLRPRLDGLRDRGLEIRRRIARWPLRAARAWRRR